jgi:hypothetical protein
VTEPLPFALCDLARRLLPPASRPWGDAMKAELSHIADRRHALDYAGGCLVAAAKARARDFDTRFAAGLWSVASVGAIFAYVHLACAARGIAVLRGARDGFLDALVRSGAADADLLLRYQSARPIVIACLLGLGLAHLAAAWFLVRRDLRRFLIAWSAALLAAILAVTIQLSVVWSADGLPSEFAALLVQAAMLAMLLLWSRGRHERMRG